ncbi:hypothetical protein FQR65_LT15957 [Abscondita terminalis]|nr:hypothetical protein FQR65_LT15957 [Abscondita terminalis]
MVLILSTPLFLNFVSAFYVTNRQEGFAISASILAKSKFYGNSTSAILDGVAVLTLLPRGENYTLTIPYAHCKGILMGTLSMELGGKVYIDCEKTGYRTELEFKLKPFLGGVDQINCISGRLKLGKETLATLDGYWDGVINIKDRRTGEEHVLWNPTISVKKTRLKRFTVSIEHQGEFESAKLWQHVSAAILCDNMTTATDEKTSLEEAQRALSKERKAKCEEWIPKHFLQDLKSGQWVYKHSDLRPWDPRNDLYQYEHDYVIKTKTKHPALLFEQLALSAWNLSHETRLPTTKISKRKLATKQISSDADINDSATTSEEFHSDSAHSIKKTPQFTATNTSIMLAIYDLEQSLKDHGEKINMLQRNLTNMLEEDRNRNKANRYTEIFAIVVIVAVLHALLLYYS